MPFAFCAQEMKQHIYVLFVKICLYANQRALGPISTNRVDKSESIRQVKVIVYIWQSMIIFLSWEDRHLVTTDTLCSLADCLGLTPIRAVMGCASIVPHTMCLFCSKHMWNRHTGLFKWQKYQYRVLRLMNHERAFLTRCELVPADSVPHRWMSEAKKKTFFAPKIVTVWTRWPVFFTMTCEIPPLCAHVFRVRVGGWLYYWPTVDFPLQVSFQVTQEAVLESWPMLRRGNLSHKHGSSLQRLYKKASNKVHIQHVWVHMGVTELLQCLFEPEPLERHFSTGLSQLLVSTLH